MSHTASYAQNLRDPGRHLTGIVFVIVFHLLLAWALANGLAREVAAVFKAPLSVHLVEAAKPVVEKPPPPVQKQAAPATKTPPPKFYAPPPDISPAVQTEPTVAVVQYEPPPPAPPAPPAPVPAPVVASVGVVCPNHLDIRGSVPYPPQALRFNKSGEVLVEFMVEPHGEIGNIRIVRSSDPVFNKTVVAAVKRFRCVGQEHPALVRVPFEFSLS
ncbi:MAG: energy transducer TonB [Zoogloeaceae bacterium]|nr:energy transducer TonB [Zoogloeaceae bacterium]